MQKDWNHQPVFFVVIFIFHELFEDPLLCILCIKCIYEMLKELLFVLRIINYKSLDKIISSYLTHYPLYSMDIPTDKPNPGTNIVSH